MSGWDAEFFKAANLSAAGRAEWWDALFEDQESEALERRRSACDARGWRCLHFAAAMGDDQAVKRLVAEGAGLEDREFDGWTPLMLAAQNGRLGCLEALLSAGADPNAQSSKQRSAAQWAMSNQENECLRVLLKAGASPDDGNFGGQTLAMTACASGNSEGLELVIAAGADLRKLNKKGQSALLLAVESGSERCVSLMMEPDERGNDRVDPVECEMALAIAQRLRSDSVIGALKARIERVEMSQQATAKSEGKPPRRV